MKEETVKPLGLIIKLIFFHAESRVSSYTVHVKKG